MNVAYHSLKKREKCYVIIWSIFVITRELISCAHADMCTQVKDNRI